MNTSFFSGRTINDINDYKMEFAVQITFRQKWNDPRLR